MDWMNHVTIEMLLCYLNVLRDLNIISAIECAQLHLLELEYNCGREMIFTEESCGFPW